MAVPAALTLMVGGALLSGNTAAGATSGTTAASASTGVLRHVTRGASLPAPVGKPMGKPGTTVLSTEFPPQERDAAVALTNRSHSARPGSIRTLATTGLQPPVVASSAVGGSAGLGHNWEGLTGFQQRYANGGNQFSVEPPDQALCVGNGQTLEAVNSVLRVFSTGGAPLTGVVDLNTFFGYPAQFNRTTFQQGPFLTDPVCIFDHGSGRFFLAVLTLDINPDTGEFLGSNHLDLAVSRTGLATGGWNIYRLAVQDDGSQGTPKHTDCPCIGDYPHMGSDANAVFITTNEYPLSSDPGKYGNNFNGAQIYAFDKRALAAASFNVNVVQFQNTEIVRDSTVTPGFTVWPAQVPGTHYATTSNGTEYFLGSIAGEEAQPTNNTSMANQLAVYAVTNTASIRSATPALALRRNLVNSEVYGVPPRSTQKAGPVPLRDCLAVNCHDILGAGATPDPYEAEGPLDSNDSRMQQVYYSGGRIYGSLDTVVEVGGNLKAGIAWFAVSPGAYANLSAASVARQGYLAVAGQNVTYPALAVLPNGTGVMAFTLVGGAYYPTAAYSMFGVTGTGAVQIGALGQAPQDGFSEYNAFGSPPRPRWGDYGAAVTSDQSIYVASEYIGHRCGFALFNADPTCGGIRGFLINWSTRVSQVTP
ncbi:MAG: hypothetical protein ABJA34_05580 [Pseudonocardiales bacterium]